MIGGISERFFVSNLRYSTKIQSNFFVRNAFIRIRSQLQYTKQSVQPSAVLKSSFWPTAVKFATHRQLGRTTTGGGGGNNWKSKFKWNWFLYKTPLLFSAGVIAFNAVAWQYFYQIPGIDQIRRRPELAVYAVMGLNGLVFLAWRGRGAVLKYVTRYGLLHKDSNFNKWGMLGSAFSHQSVVHLGVNMFVLYQFGVPVAQSIGAAKFTEIYLDGAVIGSLFSIMSPLITGTRLLAPSLGASGAVFTMFGLLTFLMPKLQVALFFIPIPMPASAVFLGSMAVNAAGMFMRWGAVDYAGHLGGSMVAVAWGKYYQTLMERRRRRSSVF